MRRENGEKRMRANRNRSRITVDLGSVELYRTLKFAAVDQDVTIREIVVQALQEWLERRDGVPNGGAAERDHG
ncbi:MAG: hypothetical protein HW388_699 [Dehalococcoidia bacterium]|nr:hypothetical protein [Dehalococcoidia bacterium]